MIAAVDFETTYNDECSIKPLGADAYFRHPNFEAYLVAIKTSDGLEFVGHPKDAPWDKIANHVWLSHNAGFDETLYLTAKDLGWWGDIPVPPSWHCTADMVAYLGYPRSLKDSVKTVFNEEISKEVREGAKGKRPPNNWPRVNETIVGTFEPLTADGWQDMLDYALDDSVWCLKLWEVCSDRWPENERWLSDHTRTICRRGVPIDYPALVEGIRKLKTTLFQFEEDIPWHPDYPLLSRAAFDRECVKHDLTPPKSLAKDDAEGNQWLEDHQDKHRWIFAYRNWRRCNAHLSKCEALERATREVAPGEFRYFGNLKYCGAHTKRWSGSGANFNLQNPTKATLGWSRSPDGVWSEDPSNGVNLRALFRAPSGKKMIALDLSQIEVRTLTWLSRDFDMLRRIDESPDIYQAFAEGFGLWSPEKGVLKDEDNDLRQIVKIIVLGSGFMASPWAFSDQSRGQLKRRVRSKYGRDLHPGITHIDGVPTAGYVTALESAGREFLAGKVDAPAYWWKKAGRLINREATCERDAETSSGKTYKKTLPQWKAFSQEVTALKKKLEKYARLPIVVEDWDWDWENVCILAEAESCVNLYREQMTKVTEFWRDRQGDIANAVFERGLRYALPSGNELVYQSFRRVKSTDEDGEEKLVTMCHIVRDGRRQTLRPWPGLLTENLAQSLARDIFGFALRNLEEELHAEGLDLLFHVHDEAVGEVPEERAEEILRKAEEIMRRRPPWLTRIPLDGEGNVGETYKDCK